MEQKSGIERIKGGMSSADIPVRLNLPEMEVDRTKAIDAATEYLFGKNCSTLVKPSKMPTALLTFMLGVVSTVIVFQFFM